MKLDAELMRSISLQFGQCCRPKKGATSGSLITISPIVVISEP